MISLAEPIALQTKVEDNNHKTKQSSTPLFSLGIPQQVQIKWLESGKPVLEGIENKQVEVSLSHDDRFCLCVAGCGPQGCDIAPVSHRSKENWVSLLSSDRQFLLDRLLDNGYDSLDIAGTRLWAAVEALRKAFDVKDITLNIDSKQGDTVLFQGKADGKELYVITFPVSFTNGSQRMVAVSVNKK